MQKEKSVELTRTESAEIEVLIQLVNKLQAESAEKQALATITYEHISKLVRTTAKKKNLEGKEFEYRDGKIIVVDVPADPITNAEGQKEKKAK